MKFEWDETKALANELKHGVSFPEASTAFGDPFHLVIDDPDHSVNEERFILLGTTFAHRLIVAAFTERDEVVRLINARLATKRERSSYE